MCVCVCVSVCVARIVHQSRVIYLSSQQSKATKHVGWNRSLRSIHVVGNIFGGAKFIKTPITPLEIYC